MFELLPLGRSSLVPYVSRTAFKKAKKTLFDETFLKFLPKYFEKNYITNLF